MRQERVIFLLVLLALAAMTWGLLREPPTSRRRGGSGAEGEFQDFVAPDVALALRDDARTPPLARTVLARPRDTHALPPLTLVEPPREPLAGLFPPPAPGPAPLAYGRLLRFDVPHEEVQDLFAEFDDVAPEDDDSFFAEDEPERDASRSLIAALNDEEVEDPFAEETYAERFARLEGYKDRYDWIIEVQGGEPSFGRIENPDRLGLVGDTTRASEPLRFTEVDPVTGREVFENIGTAAIPIGRDRIEEFHFARTVANRIALERLAIGEEITRSDYDRALALAADCVRHRLDAPRALEIGRDLYERCAAFDPRDPVPRLGLARCFEAGFDFEQAFEVYEGLLAEFQHRAEVHVRLAQLEERFLLYGQAEARLREAVATNRTAWEARWGLGAFLLRRGELDEAVEHLIAANDQAPKDPALLYVRVAIRNDLGAAYFARGDLDDAARLFASALNADDENERARAGLLGTELLTRANASGGGDAPGAGQDDGESGLESSARSFELLHARGLSALLAGEWTTARDALLAAAEADPLRANLALGALSYLAEVTGHPEAASRFAEEALEIAPSDPYALYQRGRLLGLADDYELAREALLGALETDLDFEDALASLGDMAFRLGRFEDAERYLERAVSIDPDRPELHALRGLDLLLLGGAVAAQSSFEAALALAPDDPIATGGLAWCRYLAGDTQEALIQLASLDEARRALPEDDPYRVWARAQIERLQDHEEKVVWSDNFERKRLINEWATREGAGPVVSVVDGVVHVDGVFNGSGRTTVYRLYNPGVFVSFEADVWISADSNVRAGLFLSRERHRRDDEPETVMEASVSRHKDGNLQLRFLRTRQQPELTDMEQTIPTERWVRLSIERTGEGNDSGVTMSLDGVPLIQGAPLPGLGRATSEVLVGLFVEGENSRTAHVRMDNVRVVFRQL